MARPIHANADATRRRILASASRLFSERGHGDTSMRDIAGDAKVSLATVHHYFGSKAELYGHCIEAMNSQIAGLEQSLTEPLAAGESLEENLHTIIRESYRFARRHQTALRLVMRTVVDTGGLEKGRRDTVLLPFLGRAVALLKTIVPLAESDIRMSLLSVNYLIARFALSSDEALVRSTASNDISEANTRVEDYLSRVAKSLFLGTTL